MELCILLLSYNFNHWNSRNLTAVRDFQLPPTLVDRKVLRFWIGNDDFCEACKQFQYKDRPDGMVRSFPNTIFLLTSSSGSFPWAGHRFIRIDEVVYLEWTFCRDFRCAVLCCWSCRFCRMSGSVTAWVWVWWLYITLSFLMSIHNLPGGYEVPGGLPPKTILSNKQFLHLFHRPISPYLLSRVISSSDPTC